MGKRPAIRWSWWHLVRVVGGLLIILVAISLGQLAYDEGVKAGDDTGYDDGADEGYGWGYEDGYEDGEQEGSLLGYDIGVEDGYYSGSLETCQFLFDMLEEVGSAVGGASSICPELASTTLSQ